MADGRIETDGTRTLFKLWTGRGAEVEGDHMETALCQDLAAPMPQAGI